MANKLAQARKLPHGTATGQFPTLREWLDQQGKAARTGVPVIVTLQDIESAWAPRFAKAEIEELVIPRRTMARRKASAADLTPEETDRAFRLAQIQMEADRVFGNPEKASRWLRTPNRRLSGQTPLSLLRTAAGAALVAEMLVQIDHGMFV